jgi:glycosidase
MINAIYEDPQFRDNPFAFQFFPNEETAGAFFQKSQYTFNHPDSFQFARELRQLLDEFKPYRFLVGEVCGIFNFIMEIEFKGPAETLRNYCSEKAPYGLDTVFLFKTLDKELKAPIFRELIKEYQQYFFEPLIPTWVFSNHDNFRRISRFGKSIFFMTLRFGNDEFTILKAKLNAAFQLTVRGIPFIYYGEEIGMNQV